MDKYLQDLLERMADRSDRMIDLPDGRRQSNPNATFYKADDEARQLNKLEYVDQLKTFIEKTKNEDLKKNAYVILSYIFSNTGEEKIIQYLIDRLSVEIKEWTLHTILWEIEQQNKPILQDVSIDNILLLTTHKKYIVRHGAIKCLKNTNNPKAEEKLIEIISSSKDQYELTYASSTLGTIGTKKSIPYLIKLVDYKKQDVSGAALQAILKLSDSSYLPLFIEHLKNGKLKYLGLEGTIKYGDKNVVPFVEKRIKELISKKRAIQFLLSKDETELTLAMNFLSNYATEFQSIKNLYKTLMTKKFEFLWDNEKKWLNENKQKFE